MEDDLRQKYLRHLNSTIKMYRDGEKSLNRLKDSVADGFLARAKEIILRSTGEYSSYTQQMETIIKRNHGAGEQAEKIYGIIVALKGDIEDGFLGSLTELAHADIFDSYLGMAEHLLDEGYVDAAAVITGSTLEAHLRELCIKNNIPTEVQDRDKQFRPKKASQMNQELGKTVYSQFDQKQVAAWLDLRNSAAHGKFSEYSDKQVDSFIEWLGDFISRYPA